MDGLRFGKDGIIIIDCCNISSTLMSIAHIADHFIAFPEDTPAVTAALCFINDDEMFANTKLRINEPMMKMEEART